MAISSISICNVALSQLGANLINSFSEGSTEAVLCNTFYEQARILLLSQHPWNFAIARIEIAPDVTAPIFHYEYQFTLPSNCIRILQVYNNDDYKIEGRKILTNTNQCFIKYVSDSTDVSTWSHGFINSLTALLHFNLSYPITKNAGEVATSRELFERAFTEARAVDASQDIEDPFLGGPGSLISARF